MIINISRAKSRLLCRKRSFNLYHRGLTGERKSMNLVDGATFHKGVAVGLASGDWQRGMVEAKAEFDATKDTVVAIPGTEFEMEGHWALCEKMIECYAQEFKDQGIRVIQPECEFEVVLPQSHHHCIWLHHQEILEEPPFAREVWGAPDPKAILEKRIRPAVHNEKTHPCACYQPHRFVGKTDAVVSWMNNIWLLEHKTTSISGEQFWAQWRLDMQPTGYIYGIQKALGLKVSGFVLNAIVKPSEAQVAAWNKRRKYGQPMEPKDYIKYEREAFLRSQEDLERFESELINLCNEWETDIVRGTFPMTPLSSSCANYNRVCDYHGMCVCHDAESEVANLVSRDKDYVDVKLASLIGVQETTV